MTFHLYGFIIGISIIISVQTSIWLARRRGYPPEIIWNGLWWVLIPAIFAARLYHVLDFWDDFYRLNIVNSLYLWNGGLAIFGALLGGFLGLWLYFKLKIVNSFQISNFKFQISFIDLLNLVAFGLPLAQTAGRLGNYFNKELYGLPSSLPWAIHIGSQTYHPLFAYESLWLLTGFSIMFFSEIKFNRHCEPRLAGRGNLLLQLVRNNYFAFYLIWYGFGRFFLEYLRQNQDVWRLIISGININISQSFSLIMLITGIYMLSNDSNHQT